ncbi:MAG: NADH-ubiquinone oxidoreductase-F iron-sulfur binding region domain-containing protein [Candidatus Sumerlaeota bacterium]
MTETKRQIDLKDTRERYLEATDGYRRQVIVCSGTGCVAGGADKVYEAFLEAFQAEGIAVAAKLDLDGDERKDHPQIRFSKSGCQGFCQCGPLVTVEPDGLLYTRVKAEDVQEIVAETLKEGRVVERLLYSDAATGKTYKGHGDIPFYTRQHRMILKGCGSIDPEEIEDYIGQGGYEQARRTWTEMEPEAVCNAVEISGIRGRGGGGFPTGRKWELTRVQPGEKKYVICNADEGDPGAFMDRSVMEGNPHSVLEGMMIAARAIGADEGFVYVRMEYPLAVKRVRKAVEDAEALGILGPDVFGTGRGFTVRVKEGAGAFVCGEETALIASIEGQRGMPRPKPPFPAQSGLNGKPTVINNVETLASIALILEMGPETFKELGTPGSPGTKTFALTGHVVNTGLIEVPLGTTLREVVFNIGGGVTDSRGRVMEDGLKAVQIGGPSGGCLTAEHLDLPLDFDSLREMGAMIGSGGMVVMNKHTCMVSVARFFMQFTQNESCGKCVICREGTKQMLALLDDIIEGRAEEETLRLLEELAEAVGIGSLCGLGKTAPSPVLSTMRTFREEYEAHVIDKKCPAGECAALAEPEIDPVKCKGCTICARKCPVDAISGEKKEPHVIDAEKCIKCGTCAQFCKFDAISGVGA